MLTDKHFINDLCWFLESWSTWHEYILGKQTLIFCCCCFFCFNTRKTHFYAFFRLMKSMLLKLLGDPEELLCLFPDEAQRQITKFLLKDLIHSFTLCNSQCVLPVSNLTCNEDKNTTPDTLISNFCAQQLQVCYVTFAQEFPTELLWWKMLIICFRVILHVLKCSFFHNLTDGGFSQVYP